MSVAIVNNRIDGLRVTIYDVLHYREAGRSPAEIADILPLTAEQVAAALAYIAEHRETVTAAHEAIEARIARGNPPEIQARAHAGRARMEELRRAKALAAAKDRNGEGTPGGHQ